MTIVRPATAPRERTDVKRQLPYAVLLHNDDINGFDYVVGVLRKVFHFGPAEGVLADDEGSRRRARRRLVGEPGSRS